MQRELDAASIASILTRAFAVVDEDVVAICRDERDHTQPMAEELVW
jgi:hypothetical protein